MNSIICIFCLQEKEKGSEEHVFPDSLGGLLIINDVCKVCNDKLGNKVDTHLVNHGLMQFARFTKGLKGKKGKLPNPIGVGKYKGEAETILHYKFTNDGKPESLYVVPSVKREGNKYHFKFDASEPDNLVKSVNKVLGRSGLEPMTREAILSNAKYTKTENPTMEINMEVDMESYRKAIIKIIYEMSYYWLGGRYLNDRMANKIREYILSDVLEVNGLSGKVDMVGDGKDGLAILADSDTHIAVLRKDGNRFGCYVNIFNNFYGYLVVTEEADLYPNIKDLLLVNDVKKKEIRECTLLEGISRISY